MGVKRLNLQPEEEKGEFDDDAEETLSLSDLPLTSSSSDWEDHFKEDHNSTFDQDFFEFVSKDSTTSSDKNSANGIIFCGKLIAYKGTAQVENAQSRETTTTPKTSEKNPTFRSKSLSLVKYTAPSSKQQQESISTPQKFAVKCDSSVKRASSPASYTKSRSWPLLALGMGRRFPVVMELKDIKTRQSKQSPERMMQRSDKRGNRLWGLVSFLGCKSYHTTAVVKASFFR